LLREEVPVRSDIQPGARFPDFELPDQRGERRRLSALQGDDPMVLVLARGHFCPKDQWQHRRLVELYPELKVAYTRLVTISTSNMLQTNEWRTGLGARWPFLFDIERKVQKDLDIQEYTDPHHDPMIPHTLVLAPKLEVFRVYVGYWYWGRPSNDDLRRDLREVTRHVRPDWDISEPSLREAWARKERDRFWPYGRSFREMLTDEG
jgi:peroxiredoxin